MKNAHKLYHLHLEDGKRGAGSHVEVVVAWDVIVHDHLPDSVCGAVKENILQGIQVQLVQGIQSV